MSQCEAETRIQDRDHDPSAFLAACFCAGVPIRQALDATSAKYGTSAWDSEEAQERLIACSLAREDVLCREIPEFSFGPARSSRFTRLLMDEIDHCGASVCEELVTRAAALCQTAHGLRDSNRWVILSFQSGQVLEHDKNVEQNKVVLCIGDTFSSIGLQVWEAGMWLSCVLQQAQGPVTDVRGKRVLELASGTGLCGPAFAEKAGAAHVWLSDIGDNVINNIRRNVQVNRLQEHVSAIHLDISDADHVRRVIEKWDIDTLFAADVTYDEQLSNYVVKAIAAAILQTGRVAWVVAIRRNEDTFNALPSLFEKAGLQAETINSLHRPQRPDCYPHCDWERIEAWRLTSLR